MRYSIDFAKWEAHAIRHNDDPTGCVYDVATSAHLSRFHEQEYDSLFLQKEVAVLREILLNHPRVVFVHKPQSGKNSLRVGQTEDLKLRGFPLDFGITKDLFELETSQMLILKETNTSILALQDITLNLRNDGFRILYFVVDEMSHAIQRLIRKHTIDSFLADNA